MTWIPDAVVDHLLEVADEPDLSGTRYRLVGRIGRGGMGAVYAAQDLELGREVAIKVSLDAADPSRARREARVVAGLEHPGIVPVYDVGTLPDGRVYQVMKLVRGRRLDAWASEPRKLGDVLRLYQRICEAVAFAHARGVVHRDLKPQNVMVGEFGEALVMDWGIAAPLADAAVDAPGTVAGTRAYMAPEQARGDTKAIDARSDVHALGAILRDLLANRGKVARPLAAVRDKAMSHEQADRYASALELAADVSRFLDGEPVHAHRESALERGARLVARNRVVLSLLAAYVFLRLVLVALARH